MDNMEDLPPGYRFYPTEEELVSFYLRNKLEGKRLQEMERVIPVINIYDVEPFHLPSLSGERCKGDTEQWFFFTPRQEREASGGRANRTTASGYWKATGSPGHVYSSDNRVIGLKKTMVFYKGKAPLGRKTKWKMNEYRAIEEVTEESNITVPKLRHEFSLCRVYVVSGSFRAFDRRPLEVVQRERQLHHGPGSTSADASKTMKGTSSPETSYSGEHQLAGEIPQGSKMVEAKSSPETSYSGGDQAAIPVITESATMGMVDDLEPPEWEWDQLNWP